MGLCEIIDILQERGFSNIKTILDAIELEKYLDTEYKRNHGVVYTPNYIVEAMVRDSLNILKNGWVLKLEQLKILDPCCGTGAYVIELFKQLRDLYDRENKTDDIVSNYDIIKTNIYFCDIDRNAVDITKYRLWEFCKDIVSFEEFTCNGYVANFVDGAYKGYELFLLKNYCSTGGFMLDDFDTDYSDYVKEYANNKNDKTLLNIVNHCLGLQDAKPIREVVFKKMLSNNPVSARLLFSDIHLDGGFDIIIGNPPYVKSTNFLESKEILEKRYGSIYDSNADLSIYFYAEALNLLKQGGVISFISTNTWLTSSYAKNFRKYLYNSNKLYGLYDFKDNMLFEQANVATAITVLKDVDNKSIKYTSLDRYDSNGLYKDLVEYIEMHVKNYKYSDVFNIESGYYAMRFLNCFDMAIQCKFKMASDACKANGETVENYCNGFKTGLLTGNLKVFTSIDEPGKSFLTDELRLKYPNLIKRAYKPSKTDSSDKNSDYYNILYLKSGDITSLEELPSEIKDYILENKESFQDRDATTVGEQWWSLKHGINRVESGVTHGIMSNSKSLLVKEIDADSIVLDTTTIFTKIENKNLWLVDYLNNELVEALYNKCIYCLTYPNSCIPRKQSKELNGFPVVHKSEDTKSIAKGFGLSDIEVEYLINWNRAEKNSSLEE